jgi:hypothetical protein
MQLQDYCILQLHKIFPSRLIQKNRLLENNIQTLRNFTGLLSEYINDYYDNKKRGCVESIAVIMYCDKLLIQNLRGDSMNCSQARSELYAGLNFMTQV